MSLLSTFYNTTLDIEPLSMPATGRVADWTTWAFCGILVLLTLIIVNGRRKFTYIVRALFSPRSRNQLLRESKPLAEWIYAFLFLYDFLVIGMTLYLLVSAYLPAISGHFSPPLLFLACAAVAAAFYFLKTANLYLLAFIFDCPDDRATHEQNRFFCTTCCSLALLPLALAAAYTAQLSWLLLYGILYLACYCFAWFRTINLKSSRFNYFEFFLYFCTIEILPFLVIIKMMISFR